MDEGPRSLIQSVVRAAAILELFTTEHPTWSEQQIVEATNLTRGTVYRFIQTLLYVGYLAEDSNGRLRPGPRALTLGQAALGGLDLPELAMPTLSRLRDRLGCTVNLAVLDGSEIVYLMRLRGPSLLDIRLRVGSRLPAFCTSLGRSLLACLSDPEATEVIDSSELIPRTPNTVVDADQLMAAIRRTRAMGYAVNEEELDEGLRGVAAAIRDSDGRPVAALNAAYTRNFRTSEVEEVIAPQVMDAAAEIEAVIGGLNRSA